uniref:Putative ovule protein n=1 Tax=Solanum chacoense TaxID=4108 RepID=A0A0V0IXP1_SOLCH
MNFHTVLYEIDTHYHMECLHSAVSFFQAQKLLVGWHRERKRFTFFEENNVEDRKWGRERTRKDQAPKNTNVEVPTPSQESQHQEPISFLSSERVLKMKQESKTRCWFSSTAASGKHFRSKFWCSHVLFSVWFRVK